jgi:hypothetical protein
MRRPKPGSLLSWLPTARFGETFWVQHQSAPSVAGDLLKKGRKGETATFYALHPATKTVIELVRVTITDTNTNQKGDTT